MEKLTSNQMDTVVAVSFANALADWMTDQTPKPAAPDVEYEELISLAAGVRQAADKFFGMFNERYRNKSISEKQIDEIAEKLEVLSKRMQWQAGEKAEVFVNFSLSLLAAEIEKGKIRGDLLAALEELNSCVFSLGQHFDLHYDDLDSMERALAGHRVWAGLKGKK